jgi:MFS family permease
VDRFGRRFGMMFTVGGAGICSALTALAGTVSHVLLVIIRSLSGLGYAEQAVNGTYLSELYHAAEDARVREQRGFIYSLVQGGWPIGALTAAGLTAVLFPIVGWKGCFVFAAVPALIVALAASRNLRFPAESASYEGAGMRPRPNNSPGRITSRKRITTVQAWPKRSKGPPVAPRCRSVWDTFSIGFQFRCSACSAPP